MLGRNTIEMYKISAFRKNLSAIFLKVFNIYLILLKYILES